jgi:hypothetical protein
MPSTRPNTKQKGAESTKAYDAFTIKNGLALYGGDSALAFVTELVANCNDSALQTLLKLDEPVDLKPRTVVWYGHFSKVKAPILGLRTISEITRHDADRMFHLTGKDGRSVFGHSLGQGAKMAFLSLDREARVEVYHINMRDYREDPNKPVEGFVTLYCKFPDEQANGPIHGHVKISFFMYLDPDSDEVVEFVWLTPSGESQADDDQVSWLNQLLKNSIHVHKRDPRIGGLDLVKTRHNLESLIKDHILPAALESEAGVVTDQMINADSWADEPRVRETPEGDIEILSPRLATFRDQIDTANTANPLMQGDVIPGAGYWSSIANACQAQFPMLAEPLPNTRLAYSKELMVHSREIELNGRELIDVQEPPEQLTKSLQLLNAGLGKAWNPQTNDATKVVNLSTSYGTALKIYLTVHPMARAADAKTSGKSVKQPGISHRQYTTRHLSDGGFVFKHGRLLSPDPLALLSGNLAELGSRNAIAYKNNYAQLAQTNNNAVGWMRDLLLTLGFHPNVGGALCKEPRNAGLPSEHEEFAQMFPGGTNGFLTVFSGGSRAKRKRRGEAADEEAEVAIPKGLKGEWAAKRTDIFAKAMAADVIYAIDTDVDLTPAKNKIKDKFVALEFLKQVRRTLFKFIFEFDPLMKKGFDLAANTDPSLYLKVVDYHDDAGAERAAAQSAAESQETKRETRSTGGDTADADGEGGEGGEGEEGEEGDERRTYLKKKRDHHNNFVRTQLEQAPGEVAELEEFFIKKLTGHSKDELLEGDWAEPSVEFACAGLLRAGPFAFLKPPLQGLRTQCRRGFQALANLNLCLDQGGAELTPEQTSTMNQVMAEAIHRHCVSVSGACKGTKRVRREAAASSSAAAEDEEEESAEHVEELEGEGAPADAARLVDDPSDDEEQGEEEDEDYALSV